MESKSTGTGLPACSAPAAATAIGGLDKLLQQSRATATLTLAVNEDNMVQVFLFDPIILLALLNRDGFRRTLTAIVESP
jgi:hypothetical protein